MLHMNFCGSNQKYFKITKLRIQWRGVVGIRTLWMRSLVSGFLNVVDYTDVG